MKQTRPLNSAQPKVLHVLVDVLPGGVETLLLNLLREQRRSGRCESVVAVIQMADHAASLRTSMEQVAGFRDLDCRSFFSLGFVRKFRALVNEVRPDVVQCWSYDAGVVAGAVARFMFNTKVTWALHSLDLPSRSEYSAARFFALKAVVGVASRVVPHKVISCSEAATDAHVAFGYPRGKCLTIDNGIDMHRYRINPGVGDAVRKRLAVPDHAQVAGYLGRSHPVKRLEDFFTAAAILMEQEEDLHFIALGFTPEELYPQARSAFEALPDPARMHVVGRRPDPENWIPAMDVTLLTSASEALPMVLMESLACGVPCVSTDVGSARRVIGRHGECVPPGQPARLAEAVVRVLQTSPQPIAARGHCREYFSIPRAESRYSACYRSLARDVAFPPVRKQSAHPRVIHLVNDVGYGGAQVLLKRLAIGLKSDGFDQTVVSVLPLEKIGKLAPEFERAGVRVCSLDVSGPLSGMRGVFKFAAMIRGQKPDLIQTWMFHSALIGELAALFSLRKTRTLWSIHHTLLGKESSKWTTRLIHRVLAWMSPVLPEKVIYCSKAGLDLHHASGFDPSPSALVFNGTDTHVYRPNPEAKSALRHELGIPADAPLIGMAGRYHPQKDFANLLRAFAMVQEAVPHAHLLACGPGVTRDTDALSALADACPSPGQVHLIGPRRDMARIYPALTLCALSSCEGEAFPLVLGEAMACEVPCVATDVGDSALIIGDTGRVVPARDPGALAAEMILLLKLSPQALRRLGTNARRRVEQRFALETYIRAHASLYRAMLGLKNNNARPADAASRKPAATKQEAPAA